MKKNILLPILIICSLSACSSTELIHEPIEPLGQPNVKLQLTEIEADSITRTAGDKLFIFIKTLRARIDAQVDLINKHNKLYENND